MGFFHFHFFFQVCSTQRVTEIAHRTTSGRRKTLTGKYSRRGRFMKTGNIKRRVKICQNKGGNRPSGRMSSPIGRSSSRAFGDQQGDVCPSCHKGTATFLISILHTCEVWWSAQRQAWSTHKHFPSPVPSSDRKHQYLKNNTRNKSRRLQPQVPRVGA